MTQIPGTAAGITADISQSQPVAASAISKTSTNPAIEKSIQASVAAASSFAERYAPVANAPIAASLPADPSAAVPETDEARAIRSIAMALLDPGYKLGAPPVTFMAKDTPRSVAAKQSAPEPAQPAVAPQPAPRQMAALDPLPLPPTRPAARPDLAGKPDQPRVAAAPRSPGHEVMVQRARATVLAAASSKPGIFDKLFGASTPAPTTTAYAALDGGVRSDGSDSAPAADQSSPYDRFTAVYDISARTVYMPDGSKLEAHSGLGAKMDDPKYVHVKMHGPTPPHIYDLKPREALFHGVAALRMTPVGGEGAIHGRNGLLTHSYMLGPRGDSNGCISFRNYDTFLKAYRNNEVKRIVVVASLN